MGCIVQDEETRQNARGFSDMSGKRSEPAPVRGGLYLDPSACCVAPAPCLGLQGAHGSSVRRDISKAERLPDNLDRQSACVGVRASSTHAIKAISFHDVLVLSSRDADRHTDHPGNPSALPS